MRHQVTAGLAGRCWRVAAGMVVAFALRAAAEPTPDWLALAPRLALNEPGLKSFEVDGILQQDDLKLRFRVCAQAPDRMAVWLMDMSDGTPILVEIDRTVLLYDPLSGDVLMGDGSASLTLNSALSTNAPAAGEAEDRRVNFGFYFDVPGVPAAGEPPQPPKLSATDIDLRSILQALRPPLEAEDRGEGQWLLRGHTASGGTLEADVRPGHAAGAFARVELYQRESPQPFIVLDRLALNQSLPGERFAFPRARLQAAGLTVKPLAVEGKIASALLIGRCMRALMVRMVLAGLPGEDGKAMVEKMTLRKVDWEELRRRDREVGAKLRQALAPALALPAQGAGGGAAVRPPAWAKPLTVAGAPNLHRLNDRLYRGAQPTAEGMRNLRQLGIKTIVNLRSFNSDRDEIGDNSFGYEHIYMKAWHPEVEEIVRFLKIVTDPARVPVLVHCQHGADRTGTMCALYRIVVEGWSKADALREMTEGGFGFHSVWVNLPPWIEKLDIAAVREAAGLPAARP